MRGVAVMKEATSIKALTSSLWCVCVTCVCECMVTSGVTVGVFIVRGCGVLMSEYE